MIKSDFYDDDDQFHKWCRNEIYETWILKNSKIVYLNSQSYSSNNNNNNNNDRISSCNSIILQDMKNLSKLNFNKLIIFEKDYKTCQSLQYRNMEFGYEKNHNIDWIVADVKKNESLFDLIINKIFYMDKNINIFNLQYFFENVVINNESNLLEWIYRFLKNDGFLIGSIIDKELVDDFKCKNLNIPLTIQNDRVIDWTSLKEMCSKFNFILIESWPCIQKIENFQNFLKKNNYLFNKDMINQQTICTRMFIFQKKIY
jgi:acetolactate synthase regulatory subunit